MKRDEVIKQIRKDYKDWTSSVRLLMGVGVSKWEGHLLTRSALMDSVLNGSDDFDGLLTKAIDGDKELEAVLCRIASILLYRLAETDPPPLKWFPKELAILASTRLLELANERPPRHKGTNSADFASRDWFIIKSVLYACKELDLEPTRNEETKTEHDSGCSIVAEAIGYLVKGKKKLDEGGVDEVWGKRGRFGIT